MNNLRQKLIDDYGKHYSRINVSSNPDKLPRRGYAAMQMMYGPLIRSQPKGSAYLDVGCGTGFLLKWLSMQDGIKAVGVDSSESMIKQAREYLPEVEIVLTDGLSYLQQSEGKFAGIFCTDVVEHLPDEILLEWIEAIREALIPGGFFFWRVPNAANLTGMYSRYMDITHVRSYTMTSMFQLLEAGGFVDPRVVPVMAPHLVGRARLAIEWVLHKAIFLICGRGMENVFTFNINAVGFKEKSIQS